MISAVQARLAASAASRSRAASSSSELPGLEVPGPVAADLAGAIHPRLRPEPEHVLRRHHRERRARGQCQLEELPGGPVGEGSRERVGVVGRGVDNLVLAVVLEPVGIVRGAFERPEDDRHAGEAELVAERLDVGRDHAEVLDHDRELPELALRSPEDGRSGADLPVPVARSLGLEGTVQ